MMRLVVHNSQGECFTCRVKVDWLNMENVVSHCTRICVLEINLYTFCLVLIFVCQSWKVVCFGEQFQNVPQKFGLFALCVV